MKNYKIHIRDDKKVEFIKTLLKKMGLKEKTPNHFVPEQEQAHPPQF